MTGSTLSRNKVHSLEFTTWSTYLINKYLDVVLTSSTISTRGKMYLRGWYSYMRSRQEVVQFIWNACGVKKNSLLSSVGKQDNSLFDIHLLLSMTMLFSGWWNIPYLLKNPGGLNFQDSSAAFILGWHFYKGQCFFKIQFISCKQ